MNGTQILLVLGVAGTLLIAALLSLAETSLTRMSRVKTLQLSEDGVKGAKKLQALLDDPASFLNVVLLLVLIVQLGGASIATLLTESLFGDAGWAPLVATFAMTMLIFVLAEAAPKTYAVQHSERVALRMAPIVHAIIHIPGLRPITRLLVKVANIVAPGKGLPRGPFVTEDEIRTMAEIAAEESEIEETEKEMIHSVFEFGDTIVREVMVPRPDMVVAESDESVNDVLAIMLEHGFSRLPVLDSEDKDNAVGLIYAKDILKKLHGPKKNGSRTRPKVKDLLRRPTFVPESKKVAELLREMQQEKVHMVLVVDEYGDIVGLVTMEDLLEEIVGEIADEYDREDPQVHQVDEQTLRVNARLPISELSEMLDIELPDEEWDTVGGLVVALLGRVPRKGDEVTYLGLRLVAERVKKRRIETVLVSRDPTLEAQLPEVAEG
ncbi:MAG: hemolysin family protein [Actinomycetota bacterium]